MLPPPPTAREPVFNMPGLVVGIVVALVAIHAVRGLLSPATDVALLLDLAFVPAQWSLALGTADAPAVIEAARGIGEGETGSELATFLLGRGLRPWSPLTYGLLHGSWVHVGLNAVWLAAFASPVVRRAGTARTLLLMVVATAAGAAAHWLTSPLGIQPLIGASAAVSGLMGAAATFVFEPARLPASLDPSAHQTPPGRLAGLGRIVRNRTALVFLGSWFLINLGTGFLAEPLGVTDSAIAWDAHLGGLVAGLATFLLVDPVR